MNKLLRNAVLGLLGSTALALATPASAAHFARSAAHFNHHPFFQRSFAFHHGFAHFSPRERALWARGHWWRGWRHGHFGWWWWANGGWFFYTTPIYPYPMYDSEIYYYDNDEDRDEDRGERGSYWYHCANPEGYYPYVKSCKGDWERVTPRPQDGGGAPAVDEGRNHEGPPPGDHGGYRNDDRDQDESDSDDAGPPHSDSDDRDGSNETPAPPPH